MEDYYMRTRKLSTNEICYIGVFTAVMIMCAQLAIPMPGGVPMTMQTWAVSLAGMVLGMKKGGLSAFTYILLGAIGLPVFANATGGLGVIFGPTGGFILSFPIMAFLAGMGAASRSIFLLIAGLIMGTLLNFFIGMFYFSFIVSSSLNAAFVITVLPFIPSAIIRIIVLSAFCKSIRFTLAKSFPTL